MVIMKTHAIVPFDSLEKKSEGSSEFLLPGQRMWQAQGKLYV